MNSSKKIFFISDAHLGVPSPSESLRREKLLVAWLDHIKDEAEEIYIVGDLFDFWFEYKRAIPKGFTRVLGKLAELSDQNIKIHFFTGNHDLWMFGYFEDELNIPVYHKGVTKELKGKKFLIDHGDGLGPEDHGYKFLKKVFSNKLCQWLFKIVHPDIGIGIANYWSKRSRYVTQEGKIEPFKGEEQEWLIIYAKEVLKKQHIDYFVFGHRHIPLSINLNGGSTFINLGDWISHFSYAEFDGQKMEIKYFKGTS